MENYFHASSVVSFVAYLQSGNEIHVERKINGLPKIGGFSVTGQVDALSLCAGRVEIADWKMGQSTGDEDSLQLVLYGWWAIREFGVAPEDVAVRRVFLGDGVVKYPTMLSERLLTRGRARLSQDVERMNELHDYGIRGNLEAFPPCEQEKICRQCKFQSACPELACAVS